MDLNLFALLVSNLLGANVLSVTEDKKVLIEFESKFCFNEALQPIFTAQALEFLLDSLQENTIYEITDRIDISLLFFRFCGYSFLVGPYVKNDYNDIKMQTILAERGLLASHAISLKLYYTSLPLLSSFHAQKEIEACIRSFLPSSPLYSFRKLHGLFDENKPIIKIHSEPADYKEVLRRYDYENHFLNMISSGNVEQVGNAFLEMRKSCVDSGIGSLYKGNPQASRAILRTLVRKAAEKSGLSVIVIDEITERHAQLAASGRSSSEQFSYIRDMILELTKAVHEHITKSGKYSPIIAEIVEQAELHISEEILLSSFAKENKVSESYLSKRFKKETGFTFVQYIAKKRCEKAASLLKETALHIQEISAYVGYPDNNYFIKVFKKQYGLTPSEYRKSL